MERGGREEPVEMSWREIQSFKDMVGYLLQRFTPQPVFVCVCVFLQFIQIVCEMHCDYGRLGIIIVHPNIY